MLHFPSFWKTAFFGGINSRINPQKSRFPKFSFLVIFLDRTTISTLSFSTNHFQYQFRGDISLIGFDRHRGHPSAMLGCPLERNLFLSAISFIHMIPLSLPQRHQMGILHTPWVGCVPCQTAPLYADALSTAA